MVHGLMAPPLTVSRLPAMHRRSVCAFSCLVVPGFDTLDSLTASAVPNQIRLHKPLVLDPAMSERYHNPNTANSSRLHPCASLHTSIQRHGALRAAIGVYHVRSGEGGKGGHGG